MDHIVTARTFTLEDLLVEYDDTRKKQNRQFCPICDKLREMIGHNQTTNDKLTVKDFENWVFNHPDYAVPLIIDTIKTAGDHHPPDVTANIQLAYAWQLSQCPWVKVRPALEMMFHEGDVFQGIDRKALQVLLGIVRHNNPNAKVFCAQGNVIRQIPEDFDLSDFPCEKDHPLKEQVVRGHHKGGTGPAHAWKQLTGLPAKDS